MKMRSIALFGASLLVTLATACGDDGGNNNGSCGDGHVTGSEQCDDGNTTAGDGCSASCQNETSGPRCGDNNVDVASEQCDDGNTTSGDGCSATCQNESTGMCGNGAINGSEACDDGDTMSGDGCSATCTVESGYTCTGTPSVCTMTANNGSGTCASPYTLTFTGTTTLTAMGSGDTTGSTSQVGEANCDQLGLEGTGKDQIWSFTLTDTRDVIVLVDGTKTFDSMIRVMSAPCDPATEIPEFTGADGCADGGLAGDGEGLGYVKLGPGTYYVVIDAYDDTEEGTYTFSVNASLSTCGDGVIDPLEFCDDMNAVATDGCNDKCEVTTGWNCAGEPSVCQMEGCGDGIVQTGEDCDDDGVATGDGCDATCHVETGWTCDGADPTVCVMIGCGNGLIEGTEECDDGNLVSNDRCSSTCVLESDVTETAEPNNTTPQVLTAGNHVIRAEYAVGDVDLYTFTLATPATVEVETYFTINGTTTDYGGMGTNMKFDCLDQGNDTQVAVFPAAADTTVDANALAIDSDDGDLFCSYVGPNDSDDDNLETGIDPNQLKMLPAGTYTIRVTADPITGSAPVAGRYMLDLKITGPSAPVAPVAGDIVINEIMAADNLADTNCDGATNSTNDEFIELVNVSNKTLDLTGLTLSDITMVRFTFGAATNLGPGSLTLAPGKAVTVWAGGAPNCAGVTNWFTPVITQTTLGLNDNGDTVTLKTGGATPVTIATGTYPDVGTMTKISYNLSPDITGTTYAFHNTITGHLGDYSPGKKIDGSAY